jgi:hypothetical protein
MPDEKNQNQGQGKDPATDPVVDPATGAVITDDAASDDQGEKNPSEKVKVDKNKTNEQYMEEVSVVYIVPRLVRDKFPDLVKLIYETESMNIEEREYWLQIMPIMTEEQIVKFRDILVNEKEELAKLDTEYESEMSKINKKPYDETKIKEKMQKMKTEESQAEKAEKSEEAALLDQLENM